MTDQRAAGPADVNSPPGIVDPLWGRCQADYGIQGQPLKLHSEVERLLRANPEIRLWFEVVVVSYLVGLQPPIRPDALARPFAPMLLSSCFVVIAHGVDDAVADRSVVTHRWLPQASFAAWVAEALRIHFFYGSGRPLPAPDVRWVAEPFRANLVIDALSELVAANPAAARHPLTTTWQHELGIALLPGRTATEQLAHVQWNWSSIGARQLRGLLFGATEHDDAVWTTGPATAVKRIGAHRQLSAMYASCAQP